ncbi:unnamed protein product [Victoria cruziana]
MTFECEISKGEVNSGSSKFLGSRFLVRSCIDAENVNLERTRMSVSDIRSIQLDHRPSRRFGCRGICDSLPVKREEVLFRNKRASPRN